MVLLPPLVLPELPELEEELELLEDEELLLVVVLPTLTVILDWPLL